MKKSFLLNTLLTLIFAVVGWVLFSMYGVIPQSMSIPLPESMKSYNSPLSVTGRTVRNELLRISSEYSVEPGTYSSLGFFENGDIFRHCYYDSDTDSLYYGLGSKSYQLDTKTEKFIPLSQEAYSTMIPMGRYKIALKTTEDPALYHKETFYRPMYWKNNFIEYDKETKQRYFDNERILEELLDSETEQTNPENLAALCWLTYTGRIRYWDAATNTAVFCVEDSDKNLVLKRYALHERVLEGNIDENDYKRSDIVLSEYSTFVVVSNSEFLGYSPEDKTIYLVDILSGERETVLWDVPEIYNLNYCYTAAGELVVGAQLSDNVVFWDYLDHEGHCYFPSEYKHVYFMSMNKNGVCLIQADDTNGKRHSCSYNSHEVFRNAER